MAVQKISEDVLLVELSSAGSKIAEELNAVNEMVSEECTYDVIIDFFKVELLTSCNISTLLALRGLLQNAGHQLVFYNVKVVTRFIFTVAGLRKVFVFAHSRLEAIKALQDTCSTSKVS